MQTSEFLYYSLRLKILVGGMDVSRYILILDTSIFIFSDKYFGTERSTCVNKIGNVR